MTTTKRLFAVLSIFAVTISLSGCFLFGGKNEELPEWRVNPTAIVDSGLALAHIEWYFELLELPEDSFYIIPDAEEITAVNESGSRITGFSVYLSKPLWVEDVTFLFVTRDKRLFYNISGQEARADVPLIISFEADELTLLVF
ncbi:MAG: hypothetical protein FWE74_02605 [Oscillospiraceae bacterium]|nr:hypothetical protein [Oscillospiraceae bacterium]